MSDLATRLLAAIEETETELRAIHYTVRVSGTTPVRACEPAAVLRRCAADRELVKLHSGPHECADDDYTNSVDACSSLRLLAEGYGLTA